ncbi:RNA-directed DNA polymerase, eukaryota, reverse transcriptase zinc-binding domain protein [Tanacetum coccineum]
MLYNVEVLSSQESFFCTFIYAENKGKDREKLWKELNLNKRVIGNSTWVIMGDVNVSLNLEDHSEVLKKIDRVMSNHLFLTQFNNANAIFLPYGIYNHSPAVLKIPQVMKKKNKSFRLANYVTDKVEFKELNGNLFGRVSELKAKLQNIQKDIDKDPNNKSLRAEGIEVLREFKEAAGDEEKLLQQKTKVTWLKEGDKNSAYFHKVLKGMLNKNRIMSVCAEDGRRYDNCDVAEQFVKHFEGFLGINP